MKNKLITTKINYDGSQLAPLFAYKNFGILGPSILAFRGSCDVTLEHMVDAEDLIEKAEIKAHDMLHFIIEIFGADLTAAVSLQRLLASLMQDLIKKSNPEAKVHREGDDLYVQLKGKKKLTISIASRSSVSSQIHFGINISNKGTPVPTACLEDLKIPFKPFAEQILKDFSKEYISIVEATQKVRPLFESP